MKIDSTVLPNKLSSNKVNPSRRPKSIAAKWAVLRTDATTQLSIPVGSLRTGDSTPEDFGQIALRTPSPVPYDVYLAEEHSMPLNLLVFVV